MTQPSSVLIVEDNEVTAEVLRRRLSQRGYFVHRVSGGASAIEEAQSRPYDLVLLDLLMPEMDGLAVLAALREKFTPGELPIVVLTVKEGSDDVVEALRQGANDYVGKTVDFAVILARIETQLTLRRMTAEVRELAARDPLTGLYNRRGFYDLAKKEEARARRYESPLHVLMIDIDHFKSINDRFGHEIGDHVLVSVARRLEGELRVCDVLGRWGGEEFVALLPGVDGEGAERTAERLRGLAESAPVGTTSGPVELTLSIGVASFDDSCAHLSDLLAHGDAALYDAKKAGRNHVKVFDPLRSGGDVAE